MVVMIIFFSPLFKPNMIIEVQVHMNATANKTSWAVVDAGIILLINNSGIIAMIVDVNEGKIVCLIYFERLKEVNSIIIYTWNTSTTNVRITMQITFT